jgi:hypothetical protein
MELVQGDFYKNKLDSSLMLSDTLMILHLFRRRPVAFAASNFKLAKTPEMRID